MRKFDLNGLWHFAFVENKCYEELDETQTVCNDYMCVPGCFDALPQWYCKRGTAVYRREFTLDAPCRGGLLKIDGMGLRGRFLLDGKVIGNSVLPWSVFELETGALAAGRHTLTAVLDNTLRLDKQQFFVPYTDFYGYGGFYHGVSLRTFETETALDRIRIRTLDYRTGRVSVEFSFWGKSPAEFDAEVRFDTDSEARKVHLKGTTVELTVPDFKVWSPETPALHTVTVRVGNETITERFGIREIKAEKAHLYLNGKDLYLKGFNRHENHQSFGASVPEQVMITDLQHLKQLGCNFIRGAHYPQDPRFLDLCDQYGFLFWEETPGWGIAAEQLADEQFNALQEEAVKLMVKYSFNHPSVIIFSFLNELDSHTQEGAAITEKLSKVLRAEDTGRLIAFAGCHPKEDISYGFCDLIAYNTYPGWSYMVAPLHEPTEDLLPNQREILASLRERFGKEKPIIVSEMGCCALYGQHDEANAQWTEEFQAEYFEEILKTVLPEPEIRGLCLWQLNDAKSYLRKGREVRIKPLAQNLAGVYDIYRRPKMAAAVVKRYFTEK